MYMQQVHPNSNVDDNQKHEPTQTYQNYQTEHPRGGDMQSTKGNEFTGTAKQTARRTETCKT